MGYGDDAERHARRAIALCLLALAPPVAAQLPATTPDDAVELDRVQVIASRSPRAIERTAASVSVLTGEALETPTLGATLSEKLAGTPGVLARPRQNFAQDEQISIRGFGTRASFGIRGVRLFVDGIPATMPDGQGQVAHFPLDAAERIEVLRGPFSALYGNSAGGVIQLFTADGGAPTAVELDAAAGSFGQRRIALSAQGGERTAWTAGASRFETDGWRRHSAAQRTGANAKARMSVGRGELVLLANTFRMPEALDPQGLTRAQVDADPRQASAGALQFRTRKAVAQDQLGAVLDVPVGGDRLRVLAYGGRREVEQVLSTPVAAQRNPLSAGGWVDLRSPFAGVDARWTHARTLAGRPFELIAGIAAETQRQARRGYENFDGTTLGVRGALRQQQDDRVTSVDPYVQGEWRLDEAWTLSAGVRASRVSFESRDRYITAGNPDDSGRVVHEAVSPVFGVNWRPREGLAWYAALGRGFETPTFNELGYRSDGGSGLNFALQPMRTTSAEVGLRLQGSQGGRIELAAFRADTRDELVVNSSTGGRTTLQNAGRARRSGLEGTASVPLGAWTASVAFTLLDATLRDAYPACRGSACTPPIATVPAGARIPGVPRTQVQASLRRGGPLGWSVRLAALHTGDVTVNASGDERAPAHLLFDASAGYGFSTDRAEGRVYLGVNNLADRAYVGSVIVNEANRRYYEPGPGRSVVAGLELRWD